MGVEGSLQEKGHGGGGAMISSERECSGLGTEIYRKEGQAREGRRTGEVSEACGSYLTGGTELNTLQLLAHVSIKSSNRARRTAASGSRGGAAELMEQKNRRNGGPVFCLDK